MNTGVSRSKIFGVGEYPSGTFRFKKIDGSFWNGETFRFADYTRRVKYKAKVQKLSLFISEPPPDLRVSESARRAKYELKRRAKVQGESARRAIFFHHITMNFNHIYFICHHLCTVLNMGKCLECLFFVFLQ